MNPLSMDFNLYSMINLSVLSASVFYMFNSMSSLMFDVLIKIFRAF